MVSLDGHVERLWSTRVFWKKKTYESQIWSVCIAKWNLKLKTQHSKLKTQSETLNSKLKAKLETWNSKLKAKLETQNLKWNSKLKTQTQNLKLKVKLKSCTSNLVPWISYLIPCTSNFVSQGVSQILYHVVHLVVHLAVHLAVHLVIHLADTSTSMTITLDCIRMHACWHINLQYTDNRWGHFVDSTVLNGQQTYCA